MERLTPLRSHNLATLLECEWQEVWPSWRAQVPGVCLCSGYFWSLPVFSASYYAQHTPVNYCALPNHTEPHGPRLNLLKPQAQCALPFPSFFLSGFHHVTAERIDIRDRKDREGTIRCHFKTRKANVESSRKWDGYVTFKDNMLLRLSTNDISSCCHLSSSVFNYKRTPGLDLSKRNSPLTLSILKHFLRP